MNDDLAAIYAGRLATLTFRSSDLGLPNLGPTDVLGVAISIYDPAMTAIVSSAAMTWDADREGWVYEWVTPNDGAGKTFPTRVIVSDLESRTSESWGEVEVAASPLDLTGQAEGVEPASRHFVQPWCTEADIPPRRLLDSNGEQIADVPLGLAICASTDLLYTLSGRRWRQGRSVVRPTTIQSAYGTQSYLYPYSSMSGYGTAWGFAAGWAWTALGMGWWQSGQDLSEVALQGPVRRINSVLVDGVELDASQYTLYDKRRLVRNVDASGSSSGAWPWNQSLALPITQPGTWQIDYEWGGTPPPSGRMASAELAIQLMLAFSGQDACKLPARVQNIVTNSQNVAVGDALEFLKEELTGIPVIDLFLQTYNRGKRRRRSVFLAPNSVIGRSS